jgi:hypothetical protein
MPTEEQKNEQASRPREVRVKRLNRKPGPNKSVISLGLLILFLLLFVLFFLMRGL